MTQRFIINAATVVLATLLIGCKARKIEYSLRGVAPNTEKKFRNILLDLEGFQDCRNEHEKNQVLFKSPMKYNKDEQKWYFNQDKQYEEEVPKAMTNMLAAHLRKRGSFKSVLIDKKDSCDYYVKGSVHYFFGCQLPGKSPALFVAGLILPPLLIPYLGIALTEKSRGIIVIEIMDLKIYNRENKPIYIGELRRRYDERFRARGGNRAVFRSANQSLEMYYRELSELIEREIEIAADNSQNN